MADVDRFVSLRRFETFTLHYVVQGFCMTDCRWLEPDRFVKDSRLSVGDARKRQELVEEFIWWLFEGLLIPLLKVRALSGFSFSKEDELMIALPDTDRRTSTSPNPERTSSKSSTFVTTTGTPLAVRLCSSCRRRRTRSSRKFVLLLSCFLPLSPSPADL
jgi:hypothetical protein